VTFVLPEQLTETSGVVGVEDLLQMPNGDVQIDASRLRRIDALGAVVVRAAIERFVCARAGNRIWISRPADPRIGALFCHILGELPGEVDMIGCEPERRRHDDVLLEARRLRDDTHRKEASGALDGAQARHTARGQVKPGRLLLEAFNELAINAIKHGMHSDVDAVGAACITRGGDLQVAIFNCDERALELSPSEQLRTDVVRSRLKGGGYYGAVRSASYPSTLQIMSRGALLRWRERVQVGRVPGSLPGYLAALEVHL